MSHKVKLYTACSRCGCALKKRKTKPRTATYDGHLYFDYYQCPKCKTNYANPKSAED